MWAGALCMRREWRPIGRERDHSGAIRVGWGGQPSCDGTAKIGNLGTVLWPGATHLFAMTEEQIIMKAIVVTDQAAGTAGMKLVEQPEPQAAINDVVVQVRASGFVVTELAWPSTWPDRLDRDRTPSIPGHQLAGVVTALGYGTRGLSVGQRVFGLTDWHRAGTLAEYVAAEARNLAPLPGDVDFTVGASLPISGLTAWQGLFEPGRLQAGQSVLVHGAAGAVGSMVTQLAREAGGYVIGTGRGADRQTVLDFG